MGLRLGIKSRGRVLSKDDPSSWDDGSERADEPFEIVISSSLGLDGKPFWKQRPGEITLRLEKLMLSHDGE